MPHAPEKDEYRTHAPNRNRCGACGYPIELLEPAIRCIEGGSYVGLSSVLYKHANEEDCERAKQKRRV